MQAMILERQHSPLILTEKPQPEPHDSQVLIKVNACAVCRTDLHVCDGDLKHPKLPLVPGHEIVGTIAKIGSKVSGLTIGQRVGVPWLGYTCGECEYCRQGQENLCDQARFTGYQIDGGYAEYTVAHSHYVFALPDNMDDLHIAPLLCAGLIGYRSLRMAGTVKRIGLYGFGAAAHIITQVATAKDCEVYAITKPGDQASQEFARSIGAIWSGGTDEKIPVLLDAAIIFAPVSELIPIALRSVKKGGRVVCAGIHMSDIPVFPYEILWGERSIQSVANLTRRDGEEFFDLIKSMPIETHVTPFALKDASIALDRLRSGKLQGAAVLVT